MQRGRPRHDDVLTPREWEVLDLLREGLTNHQIAGRLGVSPATAKFHVADIMGKLGVEHREDAAAWTGRPKPAPPVVASHLLGRLRGTVIALRPGRLVPAAVVAGVLGLLALLALGVALSNARSTADEAVTPETPVPEPVIETMVITYAPLTTPAKREAGGSCASPSGVLSRDGAWRCTGPQPTIDPCFGPTGATEVICPLRPEPGFPSAFVLELESAPEKRPMPDALREVLDAQAWWVETADGHLCGFKAGGTSPVVDGERINFYCDDETGLVGLPTPGMVWTARRVPLSWKPPPWPPLPVSIVDLRTV